MRAFEFMLENKEANHPKLFYDFPEIVHLDDVLKAIEGRDEFKVADRGNHVIISYAVGFADTFPEIRDSDPKDEQIVAALRREARGIVFDKETGKVLARRFHKFFNVNERVSTEMRNIDITQPHVILEKLDGSMITPILLDGEVRWGTKMGITDTAAYAEEFAKTHPKYDELATAVMQGNMTPIFEYMSRKNRIVVDYAHENMVLLAIRDNKSGAYMDYVEMVKLAKDFNVDVVRALPGSIENMESFMDEVHDIEGAEGYILRFANGHMVKMKSSWYIGLHKTKDALSSEKNILRLVIEDSIDDLKSLMDPDDIVKLDNYHDAFWQGVEKTQNKIEQLVAEANNDIENRDWSMFENPDAEKQKAFAQDHALRQPKIIGQLMFQIRNGKDSKTAILDMIRNGLGSGAKVENMRELHGTNWFDFYLEEN